MDQSGKKIGYWSVVAIGIGGMVGGGIVAVLGLSVQMTRGAAPVAFMAVGLVAMVTAYAYARLSVAFPSQGGAVTLLDRAFVSGLLTGTTNILLWISYIVMLSLYAFAFGSYGAAMFPEASRLVWKHVLNGELPEILEHKLWNHPVEGLLITSGATLLVANLFDLSSISTMGIAGFLLVFAAVNAANARLARQTPAAGTGSPSPGHTGSAHHRP
ncbi:MAG: APC family permease [Desulfosarcina sp.]|nr:APC family permease [Desulfosarcina sp.]